MSTKKKTMGKKAILDTLAKRVFAYNMLARTFLEEVNADFLKTIMDNDLYGSFPFQEGDESMKAGLQEASFYLKDPQVLSEENVTDLRAEFVALFIGPSKMKAPPYESLYRSEKKLVFQEHTIKVREVYAKNGFLPLNLKREPDDHMGLELDFMAKMSEKAYEAMREEKLTAARRALRTMKTFLDDHLCAWFSQFTDNVIKGSESDLYRGMAKVLAAVIRVDAPLLDELIEGVTEQIKLRKSKARIA